MLLIHVVLAGKKKLLRVPLSANSPVTRQNKSNNFN